MIDTKIAQLPASAAAWLTSSSTILGGSTLLGLASAVLSGQMTWQGAVGPAIGAVAAVAWPQLQPPTRTEIETAVTAVVESRFAATAAQAVPKA